MGYTFNTHDGVVKMTCETFIQNDLANGYTLTAGSTVEIGYVSPQIISDLSEDGFSQTCKPEGVITISGEMSYLGNVDYFGEYASYVDAAPAIQPDEEKCPDLWLDPDNFPVIPTDSGGGTPIYFRTPHAYIQNPDDGSYPHDWTPGIEGDPNLGWPVKSARNGGVYY